ncbi:MAG: radical SAM protein [Acidobacteriota bacterium]
MLDHLVLSVTAKCPAACKWCGAESSPRETARLSREDMVEIIDHVHGYGKLESVVFTGGEPLLLEQDLLAAIRHCKSRGLWTRVVSNAFWANTPERAREVVDRLMDAGLHEINLSCDDYHQEFIPLMNVKNANEACAEAGLPCLLGHKSMKGCSLTLDKLSGFLGVTLALFDPKSEDNPKNNLVSTGLTVPVQASGMTGIPDEELLYPQDDMHWMRPCASILQRVIILPDRRLSICCGMISRAVPEITFGPLGERSLEELIIEAHQDLVVNWLAMEGPYGMMQFIRERAPRLRFRQRYVNICHLCGEILTRPDCREVLAAHGHEKAAPLGMERGLYDLLRQPGFLESDGGGASG